MTAGLFSGFAVFIIREVSLPTAIVTDSTSDIPAAMLDVYEIYQIPTDLILDGKTYLDGFDLSRNEFYEKLPTLHNLPTTAAPAIGRFQELYDQIFSDGFTEIISIHAASALSGIYNAARLAAQEFSQEIQVIDSEQLSMGLGFQVLEAARGAREKLPIKKILPMIASVRERVHVFALLDTFTYIQRSGRVSWAKARLGSLLNIKPIVELKRGEVLNRGLARARNNGIRQLGEYLRRAGALEKLAVLHTNAADSGKEFIKEYSPPLIGNPLLVNVTTIIGTHVGPNGIGFAAVVK
jgi:DegV family protein with EDD domain